MKRLFTMLIVLSVAMSFGFAQIIDDFETGIGDWDDPNFSGSTTGLDASSSITVSTEQAYAGSSSGKVDLVDDAATTGGYFVRMTNRVAQVPVASKVGFWVYTAATDVQFRLVIWDNGTGGDGYEAGPYWTVSAANTWEYFELDLVNDAVTGWITGNSAINSTDNVTIESIQFNTTTDANAVFYIDDVGYTDAVDVPAVFFSEYIEGSSNNKGLEIYNATGATINLDEYQIAQSNNGGGWVYYHTFPAGATLADGEVWVIVTDQAFAEMQAVADEVLSYPSVTHHNGNDARAIIHIVGTDTTFTDVMGFPDSDAMWDVAGVTGASAEHTLIRKADVMVGNTDWVASAGTNADDSEWLVMDQNYYGNLGMHPYLPMGSVTFSVNMGFQISTGAFVPGTDVVNVAGSFNGWGGDAMADADGDSIYTVTLDIAPGDIEYKFHKNGTAWENVANRTYTVVEGENILPTVWFDDQEPVETTSVEVFIQVDMTVQLLNGNFDPTAGDLIVIRGGHDNYGNWGGAIAMALDPEQTNVYTHLSSFDNVALGTGYEYKFVILEGGDESAAIWEGSPNRSWTATGEEVDSDDNGYGEILVEPAYFADVTPDDIIQQDVTVTWTVDISSAYYALEAGDTLIDTQTGSDDITMWSEVNGVAINGILSQWWDWGNDLTCVGEWAMDPVDEVTYTYSYLYTAGQAKAQQYKYGINSLDNEAGFAQNREFIIDDAAATYMVPMDCFGSHNTDENLPFPVDCAPIATDTTVTFSVNMGFQISTGAFVPGTDVVNAAGTFNGWSGSPLADEDGDSIYTGTYDAPAGMMEYKYHINGTSWENVANRTFEVLPGANMLPTVWFDDQEPVETTNVEVFIQVDMSVQLLNGNFDPTAGDLIVIRGGHDNYGNWGGAIAMALDPEQTNVYTHLSSFDNVPVGGGYEYKFVILEGGDESAAIWEGSPNRMWTATGEEEDTDDNGYGEIFQEVAYFADVTPDDIITQDVNVTFNLDISSAYRALANGDTLIDTQTGSDDITAWDQVNGVAINGILSQWWDWGNDLTCVGEWAMTQTDDEGLKYTFEYTYTAGQAKAQQCKFGINSLDNEAGFAQNRDFMIDDAAATFVLDEMCFGEQNSDENLPFPQICAPLALNELAGIPTSYALNQNYPNPFNPTTTIAFALPEANNVTLTIYNALGQEIRSLKTGYLSAGNYSVTWDGMDNAGNMIPSGLYIYTMTAGEHNFSKKMLMLK